MLGVTSSSLVTYKERLQGAIEQHTSAKSCLDDLQQRIDRKIEPLQIEAASYAKDKEKLTTFFQTTFENYDTIVKGKQTALKTLEHLRTVYTECTPENVALNEATITHLTKLNLDMSNYAAQEVALSQSTTALHKIITEIETLATQTIAYMATYSTGLDSAARTLKQINRDHKTWGDKIPEQFGGANGYFMQGFAIYHKAKESQQTEGKN